MKVPAFLKSIGNFFRRLYESLTVRTVFWLLVPMGFIAWGFTMVLGQSTIYLLNIQRVWMLANSIEFEIQNHDIPRDSLNDAWLERRAEISPVGGLRMRLVDEDGKCLCSYETIENPDSLASMEIEDAHGGKLTFEYVMPNAANDEASAVMDVIIYVYVWMMLLFMSLCVVVLVRRQLKPLKEITGAAVAISNGDLDAPLPKVSSRTEIRKLRDAFEAMQVSLKRYIEDLGVATEKRVSIERDLSIAVKIQQDMLPREFPEMNSVELYGLQQPAKSVGGDLYDAVVRKVGDGDKLFFCIGDVSGKGVPAALFMSATTHLFHAAACRTERPAEIASFINNELCRGNEQNMFCTLFVGVLDLLSGKLEFVNAGHNVPLVNGCFMETKVGLPIGVMDGVQYEEEVMELEMGDLLFLYTDGVTEAESVDKVLFGDERMQEAVNRNGSMDVKRLANYVVECVHEYAKGAEQSDDITVMGIRWRGVR